MQYLGDGVALGHRRLAIIDLASGQQPLFNEDGSVAIVYNGEIYNYAGLIDELKANGPRLPDPLRYRSDRARVGGVGREVRRALQWHVRVRALGQATARRCSWRRDRLGKKPLYYALLDDGRLLFASELKSLLVEPKLKRELDPQAIEDYFAFGYVPDPRTILKSVKKLPPASTLVWKRGERDPQPRTLLGRVVQAAGAGLAGRNRRTSSSRACAKRRRSA